MIRLLTARRFAVKLLGFLPHLPRQGRGTTHGGGCRDAVANCAHQKVMTLVWWERCGMEPRGRVKEARKLLSGGQPPRR